MRFRQTSKKAAPASGGRLITSRQVGLMAAGTAVVEGTVSVLCLFRGIYGSQFRRLLAA